MTLKARFYTIIALVNEVIALGVAVVCFSWRVVQLTARGTVKVLKAKE